MIFLVVGLTIAALGVGAFLQRMITSRQPAREPKAAVPALLDVAKEWGQWLQDGINGGYLTATGAGATVSVNTDKLEALKSWLQRSPTAYLVSSETLHDGERDRLTNRFWLVFAILVLIGAISAVFTFAAALSAHRATLAGCLSAGVFGSAVAAFRSCLDRRANGFEDKFGNTSPNPKATKERFGDGMISWFVGRPVLGAAVAGMVFVGLRAQIFGNAIDYSALDAQPARLVLFAWLAGLFAKTLLDVFLGITKSLFRS